ncbi:MAG: preprotein translocase subunit SecY, partial [Solirubrobacterales bacterium]
MLQTLANALRTREIRLKIGFTAAMFLLYRIGAYIPSPGVDGHALNDFQNQFDGGDILGFLNLFSGGSLSRLSIFALGIMPY